MNGIGNWDETRQKLQRYYSIVKDQLIKFQHPFSGLFPCNPGNPKECISHVRDSVYCATTIWALYRCFIRIGDASGESFELRQSAVKCMRAILKCWMQQASKVEQFKTNQSLDTCLHTQLDYQTGNPLEKVGYNHLQMDCVGFFVLQATQMILSGLEIIHTKAEVAFMQNLVFYLERSYRIPDYGIWERGTKQNRGTTELHASSIGMAKAAIESVSGFNVFGVQGDHSTVLFTDADAHSRNSTILNTLLPRESASKGTDAALISTVSWPAFAVHTKYVQVKTLERVEMLKCRHGYKRFTRDGYATVVEKSPVYGQGELSKYRSIENEWPMFFAYKIISCYFEQQYEKAQEYNQLLAPLIVHPTSETFPWLPKFFFVQECNLSKERENPGSVNRKSSFHLEPEPRFLWGQAVYILSQLFIEGILRIHDLDPLCRHSSASCRPLSLVSRYSTITSRPTTLIIQMVLIAESIRLQQILATYGISSQTPVEIEPLKLWPPQHIVKACLFMGHCKRLKLNGRPPRPLGALGSSKFYRVSGSTVLVFPHLFEDESFYYGFDMCALIDEVKNDLLFLSKWWRLKGRPNYCFLVKENMIIGSGREHLIRFLASLQTSYVNGVRIVLGRAQNFVASGCTDRLDFFPDWAAKLPDFEGLKQLEISRSFRSLTELPMNPSVNNEHQDQDAMIPEVLAVAITRLSNYKNFDTISDENIAKFLYDDGYLLENALTLDDYKNDPSLNNAYAKTAMDMAYQLSALHQLFNRHGLYYTVRQNETISTLLDFLHKLYQKAGVNQVWTVVRLSAALLGRFVNSLAPCTSSILVSGIQLTIGAVQGREELINKPMNPNDLCNLLEKTVFPVDPIQLTLQQELILIISALLNQQKSIFKDIAIIRLGWFIEAMKLQLEMEDTSPNHRISQDVHKNIDDPESCRSLGACCLHSLSPSNLKSLLCRTMNANCYDQFVTETSRRSAVGSDSCAKNTASNSAMYRRQLDGCLGRVPELFYQSVYEILEKAPCGILIMSNFLPQNPTLTDMTPHDLNLIYAVELLMQGITDPSYRALFVETIMVIATILKRNKELAFTEVVDFRLVIQNAMNEFAFETHINCETKDNGKGKRQRRPSWPANNLFANDWKIYEQFISTPANIRLGTTAFLAKAAIGFLLHGNIDLHLVNRETCCLA